MSLPRSTRYLVIGAGIHGLSTAYHLAKELRTRGLGSGSDILVVDKTGPGAGASGIACGVVRNNYFQPAMSELMQACVEVWESDPEAYAYNPVGYIALGPERQESDLTQVYERHQRIGYQSELILGEAEVDAHMKELFPDWRAKNVTVCLHERQGGFAFNLDSVQGLVGKCESEGVTILSGVEVTGFVSPSGRDVTAVETSEGTIEVEHVVVAPGPWAKHFWSLLGLPMTLDVRTPTGDVVPNQAMWTYWNLQEGEIQVDPKMFSLPDGGMPPVVHLDTDAPLRTDDGKLITDDLWGIYFKQDRHGVQGGASPLTVGPDAPIDPYPSTTDVDAGVPRHVVCGALALDEPLRGLPTAVQARALGRHGRVHGRQLPRVRPHAPERVHDLRLEPRLQDDRGRTRGREGARGRALEAPLPVPLRALRDGRPAPRLELAVPLVVAYVASAAPRRAARSRSGSSARDRASASKRSGPWSPRMAASSPRPSSTGTAIACSPTSRSPLASP